MPECTECGARYTAPNDDCAARFNALLALDHSRQEPWGSRHGQAFAAFALQHPLLHAKSLDHAWASLYRIYVDRVMPQRVFEDLAAHHGTLPAGWTSPTRPSQATGRPSVTIADLGDFEAETYPARLDDWCRASLSAWGCRAGVSGTAG